MTGALKVTDFIHALPLLFVAVWACLVLLASALGGAKSIKLAPITAVGAVLGIIICAVSWLDHAQPQTALFGGMLIVDRFALFLDIIFLTATLLTVLIAHAYVNEHRFAEGEFYAMLMLSVVGMMLLVHAGDFITLLIGLETMSLAVYSLVASWTEKRKSTEGGLKYYIMGAVASAFLLYGMALIYGITGVTGLGAIAAKAPQVAGDPLFTVAMLMIIGALGFKVAMVPFHMWTPDAYEGAPTPITGFMAAAVKAAGFGVLVRVVLGAFGDQAFAFGGAGIGWANIFWTMSILTMTVGNIVALRQTNIKRMLAYSSISHAGYIMIGVIASMSHATGSTGPDNGPVLFYLLQYAIATVGAFGVVAWAGSRGAERNNLEDWSGLAGRHPIAAATMTLFLLSLAGIPPTSGFFAKLYVFKTALGAELIEGTGPASQGMLLLVIIAAANSVISIFYYLRPVVEMYFREGPTVPQAEPTRSGATTTALVIAAVLVLLLGMMPGSTIEWAGESIMALGR